MKKVVVFMAIMLALTIVLTGTVYAAENGFEAKVSDKNPAFTVGGTGDMEGQMVVNENNNDLHFSSMGYIMIPGNAAEMAKSFVFETMYMGEDMGMKHLAPPGRVQ